MADIKTKPTKASALAFLNKVEDAKKRSDSLELLSMFKEITGEKPTMWGEAIVGFGSYHYKSRSGQEADWPLSGFSPRKQNLTLYVMPGFEKLAPLLKKLGKHKTSVACLYIKRLDDIDRGVLREIIAMAHEEAKRLGGGCGHE